MISMTESARQRMDQYISQVRTYLRGCKDVDPDQVERDLRDHIERDLQTESPPVSAEMLGGILARLGAPWQWIPQGELPWWRRIVLTLRTGPEDFRLAYVSLILLLVGCVIPYVFPYVFPIALIGSFIAARAVLAFDPEATELEQKRWLIYPALILTYLLVLGLFLLWPAGVIAAISMQVDQGDILKHLQGTSLRADTAFWLLVWLGGGAIVGIWWVIAGAILVALSSLRRACFKPFLQTRRLPQFVIAIGICAVLLCGASALLFYRAACRTAPSL